QDCLAAHNDARNKAGLPSLSWDEELANMAQSFAQTLAVKDILVHGDHEGAGQNLYGESGGRPTCGSAVDNWVNEKQFYNDEKIPGPNFDQYGHYTQVMWKDTTHVGCGLAFGKDHNSGKVVCDYKPAGNVVGQTPF
ncbi:CAP domain-containing protein, partial [Blyttiomyces helicus]